jgi:hypothetical protein
MTTPIDLHTLAVEAALAAARIRGHRLLCDACQAGDRRCERLHQLQRGLRARQALLTRLSRTSSGR